MANKDTRDTVRQFLAARKLYRKQLEQKLFPAYTSVVTPALHNTTKLVSAAKKTSDPMLQAIEQQAMDLMLASQRAVDLRKKTFRNYVNESRAGRIHYDFYEDARQQRYERGVL
jgi:hypothetical protein